MALDVEQFCALVPVNVYDPAASVVTPVMDGFCKVELNEFGPVQLYVFAPDAVRFKEPPITTGLLLPTTKVGNGFTVIVPVAITVPQPPVNGML